MSTLKRWVRK